MRFEILTNELKLIYSINGLNLVFIDMASFKYVYIWLSDGLH